MTTESAPPNTIQIDTIDRASVRALVEAEGNYLALVAKSGGNTHQASLDRLDVLLAFMSTLSPDDATKFGDLYSQESIASAKAINDKTAAINAEASAKLAQSAQAANNVSIWISLIVFFIILITAIKAFR